MTVKELAKISLEHTGNPPKAFLIIAFQILRTVEQKELATTEGAMASASGWIALYGGPTKESIYEWLDHISIISDRQIPQKIFDAVMDDRKVTLSIRCRNCTYIYESEAQINSKENIEIFEPYCPKCKSQDVEIIK